jgi:hypothetical protein
MRAILRKVAGKLGQGKEVIGNWRAHQVDILQQRIIGSQLTTTQHFPPLASLLQHACEVEPLEYDQTLASGLTLRTLPHQNSISRSEDSEPMWLTILPLSIDILAVRDVDEGKTIDAILFPVRYVEGEIVVNKYAQPVTLALGVHLTLVLAVAEVRLLLHFNIKIISAV